MFISCFCFTNNFIDIDMTRSLLDTGSMHDDSHDREKIAEYEVQNLE